MEYTESPILLPSDVEVSSDGELADGEGEEACSIVIGKSFREIYPRKTS